MATSTTDPFTLIHQKLWTILTAHAGWTAAVKAKMRFDQTAYPGLLDMNLQPGDCPLVALLQSTAVLKPFAFDTAALDINPISFPMVVVGADLKIISVNQVIWQTVRALTEATQYLGYNRLVRSTVIRAGQFELGTPNAWSAGHKRVTGFLTIDVTASIFKAEVLSGEYTIS